MSRRRLRIVALVDAGIFALGTLSASGGWLLTRDARYEYVRSAGTQVVHTRLGQEMDDTLRSYGFALVAFVTGGISAGIGTLIQIAHR